MMGPQGFGEAGEKDFLFLGSWGALITIFWEQAHSFGDLGSPVKKSNINLKISP